MVLSVHVGRACVEWQGKQFFLPRSILFSSQRILNRTRNGRNAKKKFSISGVVGAAVALLRSRLTLFSLIPSLLAAQTKRLREKEENGKRAAHCWNTCCRRFEIRQTTQTIARPTSPNERTGFRRPDLDSSADWAGQSSVGRL